MVDLVKIRRKAKKGVVAPAEEKLPATGAGLVVMPAPAAALQPERMPGPESETLEPHPAAAAPEAGREHAEPVAVGEAAVSKLDRFREQAGRLRDAVSGVVPETAAGDAALQLEVLSFVIAGEHYAADIESIVEIVTPRGVTRVPNCHPSVVGVVSLRGTMVTIVDVRTRLGHGKAPQTADTRIIVVDHHGETIGFEVDRVLRVLKIGRAAVESHPVVHSSEMDDSIVGVFRHEGALTILLDFDKLLDAAA